MVGGMDKEVGQWSRKAQESDLGTEGVSKEKCMFPGGYANNTGLFIFTVTYMKKLNVPIISYIFSYLFQYISYLLLDS